MAATQIGESLEVLTLGLGGEVFAIEAGAVREILDLVPVTEVPGARAYAGGVINVRGRIVPLADLRVQFGMPIVPPSVDTRIVVIEIDLDGDPTIVGILADKVYEVTQIAAAALEQAPRIGMRWRQDFIRYIGKWNDEFIVVPDINRILN
ncbi:MAG: chemotaxis protein CheW [Rhodospirillales bacterium]